MPKGLSADRITYLCLRGLGLAGRVGYSSTCLKRCLLLFRFLRSYGVPVIIHFGVKLDDGRIAGHSWLTLDGELYRDTEEKVRLFTRIFSVPPAEDEGERIGDDDAINFNSIPIDG